MSAIKAGDLVMVVKPHGCGCPTHDTTLGLVFRVVAVRTRQSICGACQRLMPTEPIAMHEGRNGIAVSRCKRIPPLDQLREMDEAKKFLEPA